MNLYFLDNENKQHLVATDVNEAQVSDLIDLDLIVRKPDFKVHYYRVWWDDFIRMWIDFGSHTEFYLLQDEKKALNVIKDDMNEECKSCEIQEE